MSPPLLVTAYTLTWWVEGVQVALHATWYLDT